MSAFFPYDISPRFSTEFNLLFGCIYSRWIGRQHLHTPKGRERDVLTYSIPSSIFGGFFFFIEFRRENFYLFFEQRCSGLCLGCRSLWSECDWFRWAEICLSWKWAAICSGKFKIFSLNGSFFTMKLFNKKRRIYCLVFGFVGFANICCHIFTGIIDKW